MANHASALKAHRQSLNRRNRNRSNSGKLRTALKRFSTLLQAGKIEEAKGFLSSLYRTADKAVQKKVLSKNAADRHKSRLTRHLHEAALAARKG